MSASDPQLAAQALAGLRAYEQAPRRERPLPKPEIARVDGARLRDHGGDGPIAVLVPSLINPPRILDLDAEVSVADAVCRMGRRTLLLDWGKAEERAGLSVAGHVEQLLLPMLRGIGGRYYTSGSLAGSLRGSLQVADFLIQKSRKSA